MYFIFRHSEKSSYKDKIGRYYHFTNKSPNYRKVKKGAKILLYKKEINSIIGVARINRIVKNKVNKTIHFFAFYNLKKFREPLFCDNEFLEKVGINLILDSTLPGIIPINKSQFEKILGMIKWKRK